MFTALLIDDEPLANSRMREMLAVHPEIEIIGVAGGLAEAKAFLDTRAPDVVFLDVEMPGGSGLDLLESVPDATQVVFVTAREKYAVQAFAVAALDYLVKPVDPERLAIRWPASGSRRRASRDGQGMRASRIATNSRPSMRSRRSSVRR
jgi:two-component system LytT family response regulator